MNESLGPSCDIFLFTKDATRTTSPLSIRLATPTPFYTHLQYSILPISKTHPPSSNKLAQPPQSAAPPSHFSKSPNKQHTQFPVSHYQSRYLYYNHSSRTKQNTTNAKMRSKISRSKHPSPSSVGKSFGLRTPKQLHNLDCKEITFNYALELIVYLIQVME